MKPTYEDLEQMIRTRDIRIKQLEDQINGLKLKNQEYIKALKSKEYTICRQRERLNIHGKLLRDMEILVKYWRDHGHTF